MMPYIPLLYALTSWLSRIDRLEPKLYFADFRTPSNSLGVPFTIIIAGQSASAMFGERGLTRIALAALGKSELHQAHTQHLEFFRSLIPQLQSQDNRLPGPQLRRFEVDAPFYTLHIRISRNIRHNVVCRASKTCPSAIHQNSISIRTMLRRKIIPASHNRDNACTVAYYDGGQHWHMAEEARRRDISW
jgi:hypothetical protein